MRAARLLLRSLQQGVLSTISVQFPGYPFGSALPYAVDPIGRPLILVSDLAAHTQNIREDARVSLCAHQDDVLAGSRVTIVGTALVADGDEPARTRYFTMFPDALTYAAFGDFHLYRIEPEGAPRFHGAGKL
jgi:putative heme iron utilization protein